MGHWNGLLAGNEGARCVQTGGGLRYARRTGGRLQCLCGLPGGAGSGGAGQSRPGPHAGGGTVHADAGPPRGGRPELPLPGGHPAHPGPLPGGAPGPHPDIPGGGGDAGGGAGRYPGESPVRHPGGGGVRGHPVPRAVPGYAVSGYLRRRRDHHVTGGKEV